MSASISSAARCCWYRRQRSFFMLMAHRTRSASRCTHRRRPGFGRHKLHGGRDPSACYRRGARVARGISAIRRTRPDSLCDDRRVLIVREGDPAPDAKPRPRRPPCRCAASVQLFVCSGVVLFGFPAFVAACDHKAPDATAKGARSSTASSSSSLFAKGSHCLRLAESSGPNAPGRCGLSMHCVVLPAATNQVPKLGRNGRMSRVAYVIFRMHLLLARRRRVCAAWSEQQRRRKPRRRKHEFALSTR
jgi:hypothetical protein